MEGVVALVVVGVLGAIAASWYFSTDQVTLRTLRRTPKVAIGDLVEGTDARITGQVVALDETLAAPLSGRACVYYQVTVDERRSSGNNTRWVTIIREVRGVPFAIGDGTGRAIVDPSRARVVLAKDATTRSGTFDDATPAEEALLARHGKKSQGWVFNKGLRYSEGVLEVGETVAVAGRGVREPDPDAVGTPGGYRDGPATRVRMTGAARFPLHITDRTGDV